MRKRYLTENDWDKKLNIDTIGRDASVEDEYHYPYEPTPYSVLERLVESRCIAEDNIVIDYGCGKGRVGFFINYKIGCKVIGIEFENSICSKAQQNVESYLQCKKKMESCNRKEDRVSFYCMAAEQYTVEDADCFYFFNPFSVEVLQSVVGRIKKSYYNNPREMKLFFYYPSDEYISYLMTVPELCFEDEIDCTDLFEGKNVRERIVVFEML